jgi:integrase/recombinase XerD
MVIYRAERALSPHDGTVSWVVVDDDLEFHAEANGYLAALRARDCSPNTERVYASRVALYLSNCDRQRIDWRTPSVDALHAFLRWLVTQPVPPRGRSSSAPRYRSRGTANAVMTTVCEFLRYGAARGWVPTEIASTLSSPKHLTFTPPGYNVGEDGQFRRIQARAIRFNVSKPPIQALSDDQVLKLQGVTERPRDKFLVGLLITTGMRIGEALGLRREDMHFLSRATELGCSLRGPHVHVKRRLNDNGALAKSKFERSIPITDDVAGLYADYQHERFELTADNSDMVFVNLYRPPLGRPMTYSNTKDLFDRLSERTGFAVRPHMLRHTAATAWIRGGTPRDVVQDLLGHVSGSSMEPYLHPTGQDKRDAVELVATRRKRSQ